MTPLFSIITVTYNAENVVERTLKSVAEQTCPNIEHIIIDGASTDKTLALIQNSTFKVPKFVCVSEPDKGLYDAMNKGLQYATGDYVWFLNAGDTFQHAGVVYEIGKMAQREGLPDIIYGETDLVDMEGKFMAKRRLATPLKLTWKSFRMGMVVCHQAFIMKREKAPLYDLTYRYSADFDWCIRCMKVADKMVNSNLRIVNYLYEGLTTRNRKASLSERYKIMQKYYGKAPVMFLHTWFAVRFYWAKWIRGIV